MVMTTPFNRSARDVDAERHRFMVSECGIMMLLLGGDCLFY